MTTPAPQHQLDTERDTERLAAQLAATLDIGDTVHLVGELGAGKTRFARAIAAALGHDTANVSSPTFAIAQRYEQHGAPTIVHVDAHRLSHAEDPDALLADLGIDPDHAERRLTTASNTHETNDAEPRHILLVEWPDRLPPGTLPPTVTVRLDHAKPNARTARIERHT